MKRDSVFNYPVLFSRRVWTLILTVLLVPVVSAATGLLYAAHKDKGVYQYVGLDWTTGEIKSRWVFPDDSRRWNALGGITTVMDNGDLMIGGVFAVKRLKIGGGATTVR